MAIAVARNNNKVGAKVVSVDGKRLGVVMSNRGKNPIKGDEVIITAPSRQKTLALNKRRGVCLSDVIAHGVITDAKRYDPATIKLEIEVHNKSGIIKLKELERRNSVVSIRKIGSVLD